MALDMWTSSQLKHMHSRKGKISEIYSLGVEFEESLENVKKEVTHAVKITLFDSSSTLKNPKHVVFPSNPFPDPQDKLTPHFPPTQIDEVVDLIEESISPSLTKNDQEISSPPFVSPPHSPITETPLKNNQQNKNILMDIPPILLFQTTPLHCIIKPSLSTSISLSSSTPLMVKTPSYMTHPLTKSPYIYKTLRPEGSSSDKLSNQDKKNYKLKDMMNPYFIPS